MKPWDAGAIMLIFATWPIADSFGQRFDATYPHAVAHAITAGLIIGGLTLIAMKGNKK